jgi:hypothetical protein
MPVKVREGDEIILRGKVKFVHGTNITFQIAGYNVPITIKTDEPSIVSVESRKVKRPT